MPSCKNCDAELTVQNTYRKGKSHNYLHNVCKQCWNNRATRKQQSTKSRAIKLLGGCCQNCGYAAYEGAMHFHHRDPSTKDKNFRCLRSWSWERVCNELNFCDLLCANCHAEHHTSKETLLVTQPIERKKGCCTDCGSILTAENKYKNTAGTKCKKCFSAYTSRRWVNLKKKAIEYKGGGCEKCGYDGCYGALQFHHLDPTTKSMVWNKLKKCTFNVICEELDKCVCLCANCHAEEHAL